MTFLTDIKGLISADNSNDALSQTGYNAHQGTALGGSTTTISLAADASSTDVWKR